MIVETTALEGVMILRPDVYSDGRGYFMETHHQARYRDHGIDRTFVQDNLSYSVRGTLRGLHFQVRRPQAKLVQVIAGRIWDVAVDLRPSSATYCRWLGVSLSDENHRQLFIPEGFAHGFCVLSPSAHFMYKCTDFYAPDDEAGVVWSDPDIGIHWPVEDPIVSEKDRNLPRLAELSPRQLPDGH